MNNIIITGAREGNLKNVSLEIPRNQMVVLTGVSGSGKSTLAKDVLYQECQRQYLEAMGYQGIQKPEVDTIQHVSPAIIITQTAYAKNARSSVGTVTDIYTDLRMIYEKLSLRSCPNCHEEMVAADCREEVEKAEGQFKVFQHCPQCGYKMDKLTRSHFSANTREGACSTCQGLGEVLNINPEKVIDETLSLEEGAVDYWDHAYKDYQIGILYKTFTHYGIAYEPGRPVKDFTLEQRAMLLHGFDSGEVKKLYPDVVPPKMVTSGKFEGVYSTLWRRLSEKGGITKQLEGYFASEKCPACQGERLNELSRSVTVQETRLPELVLLSLEELLDWMTVLESSLEGPKQVMVAPYVLDVKTKIQRIVKLGLGYLTLDRQTMTLSGGEAQRIKLAATLDSTLTGILYILDEPTIGLHPKDTHGIIKILKNLRDLGNTILVIEHDTDVMRQADHIIDIGPGSGKFGGKIIGEGSLDQLMNMASSVTGTYLKAPTKPARTYRKGSDKMIWVKNATLHNLKNTDVAFPVGCLTSVTGVSGSGKSTLVLDILAKVGEVEDQVCNQVLGTEVFHQVITVEQSPLTRMKRSNVATYSGMYAEIRKIFGDLPDAKSKKLTTRHFSFNTKGGRCEHCEGLGYVTSNMLFFENVDVLCPVCGGKQFNDRVLSVQYRGYSIKEVLSLSVDEALEVFKDQPKIVKILELLLDVGLGYLELGQTLTTLSGGEGQRLKLAKELVTSSNHKNLYLIDEPTTGLHPLDVEHFLKLLNRMVDAGNTVIVIEHNQQVIEASDWVIDLGPGGGIHGGQVVATGSPLTIKETPGSVTGQFLLV